MDYQALMKRCLELAEQGRGRTSPNPLVGAVIVNEGEIVGEGYHQKAGTPHAEVWALRQAGDRVRGGTLVVNLEPCCHYGKTPPCTNQIIDAGIKRVVVALADPNPKVAGNGLKQLREAGIEVVVGVLKEQAKRLNEVFLKYITKKKPFVTWKTACSLDGRVATKNGDSRWVTGAKAREFVHELRAQNDGIMVGSGTVLADNPHLTARPLPDGLTQPVRIILDKRARLDDTYRVFAKDNVPVFHFVGKDKSVVHHEGVNTICSPTCELSLSFVLKTLAENRITSVLLEGGPTLATRFWQTQEIDKLIWFIAPKVIGADGVSAIGSLGYEHMIDVTELRETAMQKVGNDWCVTAYFPWSIE